MRIDLVFNNNGWGLNISYHNSLAPTEFVGYFDTKAEALAEKERLLAKYNEE